MKSILTILLLLGFKTAMAGTVIANKDLNITEGDIKKAFSGDIEKVGGTKLALADNNQDMENFVSKVLGKDSKQYKEAWTKKEFRDGVSKPKSFDKDEQVIDHVKGKAGAVGYISGSAPSDVKTVSKY